MQVNWLIIFVAGLIPVVFGYLWYHPKVFGNLWQTELGLSEDKMKGGNMGLMMLSMYVFSFIVAFMLQPIVMHQWGLFSLLENQPGMHDSPPSNPEWIAMMAKYGTNFRSFGHGVLHGTVLGLFIILPIVRIIFMFEKRSWKYTFVTAGFWIISLALMGGFICQYA
ncbi:MAG: DUF1761 domain-containing protein [Saprospiraceae bacterium]